MKRADSSWSEDEVKLLKELVPTGLTARQISDKLPGRTRNAVIGMTHRLGMRFPSSDIKLAASRVVRMPRPRTDSDTPRRLRRPRAPVNNVVKLEERSVMIKISKNPVRLTELPACGCRFPVSRDANGEWQMCADRRTVGFYCEEHAQACYPNMKKVASR